MKLVKRSLALLFFLLMTAFGAALSLKAAVGVGPWDALAQSLSFISGIKVGTVGFILNTFCVIAQLLILGKKAKPKIVLQLLVGFTMGFFINLFYYDVLASVVLNVYWIRIVLVVIAFVLVGIGVSAVLVLDSVSFCLEGICMVVSDRFNLNFARFRQAVDVFVVILVVALTVIFKIPPTIREGCIISMLIFGPLLALFMPPFKVIFKKYHLID